MAIVPQTKGPFHPASDYGTAAPKLANFQRYRKDLVVPQGQEIRYKQGQGYYTVPKLKTSVVKAGTPQSSSLFETPAQIEARVTKMADATYARQQSDLDAQVEQMKKEAEGRRLGMIKAYQAAGDQSAAMAANVQGGWNTAADKMQGLAEATTGGIGDALRAATAGQDQALAHIGAAGTGFDATSQQGVENYRGGTIPAEGFIRSGGVANEYLQRMPDSMKRQGLSQAYASEDEAIAKIMADRATQVRTLGENRVKYESDLREQLMGARKDQMDAFNDAKKILADVAMKKATLKSQYRVALLRAKTQTEIQAAKDIYSAENHALDVQESNALVDQRNASAALSNAKAGQAEANPTGAKPPSGASIGAAVTRANTLGTSVIDQAFANIWATVAPSMTAPAGWKPPSGTKMKYVDSPEYAAKLDTAKKWNAAQRKKSFGTIMSRTIKAISRQMKPQGYSATEIKKMAYDLVSARVETPDWWKKLPQNKALFPKV